MNNPTVSVIIPAYNSAATIDRALDSALSQTLADFEVIVVDDASADQTRELVRARQLKDKRIELIAQRRNGGPAVARNTGIQAARGTYVAFLDADDQWMPEKLALQVRAMEANHRASMCGCAAVWQYPDGSTEYTAQTEHPPTGADAWQELLGYAFVHTSYVLAPRSLLLDLNGFDEKLLVGEDQDLWIRLALAGEVVWVPETLVKVNNLATGFMRTHSLREAEFLLPMLERHILSQRHRLGPARARELLGRRRAQIGRNLYLAGSFWRGAMLILQAIASGHAPLDHAAFLIHASVPGRWIKSLIRRSAS